MNQITAESLAESTSNNTFSSHRPSSSFTTGKATLKALFVKSMQVQSRNYCSNICQIVSPVLCLIFTVVVRTVVQGVTTGAVKDFGFPQPFNMPIINKQIKPTLNLTCQEIFYYQLQPQHKTFFDKVLRHQFKQYCYDQNVYSPTFIQKESINKQVMECVQRADKMAFQRGDDLKTQIPDGTIKVNDISSSNLQVTLGINDFRLPQYHKNNGVTKMLIKTSQTTVISTYLRVTEGMMSLLDKMTHGYLQTIVDTQKIVGSFMYMPFSGTDNAFVNKITNVLGSGLYPLGMALLMPVLLYMVVSQKQQKQIQIMKMNGLNPKMYWLNFFVVSVLLSLTSSLLTFFMGRYVIDIAFFQLTSMHIIWVVYLGWAVAQTALTSLVQIFLDSAKTATIVGYLMSIFSCLIGMVLSTVIFPTPYRLPFVLILFPPFALCRIIFYMGMSCAGTDECYKSISAMDGQALLCVAILYLWFIVYVLAVWLNEKVQQQYGSAQQSKLLRKVKKMLKKQKKQILVQQIASDNQKENYQLRDMQLKDYLEEQLTRLYQKTKRHLDKYLGRELSKKYQNTNGQEGRNALSFFSIQLKQGQIVGLLGPNGAGKTTLISVLTGMYPKTQGQAWIGGAQIGKYLANRNIGVCPQFDILWNQLTVCQHLWFYCRIKHIPQQLIPSRISQLLAEVDLIAEQNMVSTKLSGGMKRRLSIACALAGRPSLIILDEPSSGLDPYHRRQVWNILKKVSKGTSILLTSHIMEEVEVLCDRIAIINEGQMKCIGKTRELQHKFGRGYQLSVSYTSWLKKEEGDRPQVVQKLHKSMKLQVINQFQTSIVFKISKQHIQKCVGLLKGEQDIQWMIKQPSLHDLFLQFTS